MKKYIALVLCLAMLLVCAAAAAEAEKESLGVMRVAGAFDIRYSPMPDDYTIEVYSQTDDRIAANVTSTRLDLPQMILEVYFSDDWSGTERLNDVSEEDLQAVKDDFYASEYDELTFDMKETAAGTQLLIVKAPGGQDAYVYTIYKDHEIEIHLFPGLEQEALSDEDIDRVVAFLSNVDFVPIEDTPEAATPAA